MASIKHTARAMMSLVPVKCVLTALETTAPPVLFCSVSARFMHLSLPQKRSKTQRLRGVSVILNPYHTILPSPNRYELRDCKSLWEWFHLSAPVSRSFSTAINFPMHHHCHVWSMRPRVHITSWAV